MAGTVERSLQLLSLLASNQAPATVTEVGSRLGVSIASASRLIQTLIEAGALQRNETSGRLEISVNLVQIGAAALRPLEFRRLILPALASTITQLGRPVNVAVPSANNGIWLESISINNGLVTSTLMGVPIPYHAATMGKAMLAFLPQEHIERILSRKLQPFTDKTIVDPEGLRAELALIRDCRFAINRGEFRRDGLAVAVPLIDGRGYPVAALSVPASSDELEPEGALVQRMADLGKRLSDMLGHAEQLHDSFV